MEMRNTRTATIMKRIPTTDDDHDHEDHTDEEAHEHEEHAKGDDQITKNMLRLTVTTTTTNTAHSHEYMTIMTTKITQIKRPTSMRSTPKAMIMITKNMLRPTITTMPWP